MRSFLPWLLGGYLVWLFVTTEPSSKLSWAAVMGSYLTGRDRCAGAKSSSTAPASAGTTTSSTAPASAGTTSTTTGTGS